MKRFSIYIVTTTAALQLFADVLYVPDSSPGNSDLALFGYGRDTSLRYQQVYSASSFSTDGFHGGLITAIGFRFVDFRAFGGGVSNIQINLSTTGKPVDGLSSVFSENVGTDDAKVFGPRPVVWENSPGFSAQFTFDKPFSYDPAAGNLLLDLRIYQSGMVFGMGSFAMDASNVHGDAISRVAAFDVNSVSGTADTIGLVTAFEVTPVPEPGLLSLFLAGMSLMTIFASRKQLLGLLRHKTRHKTTN